MTLISAGGSSSSSMWFSQTYLQPGNSIFELYGTFRTLRRESYRLDIVYRRGERSNVPVVEKWCVSCSSEMVRGPFLGDSSSILPRGSVQWSRLPDEWAEEATKDDTSRDRLRHKCWPILAFDEGYHLNGYSNEIYAPVNSGSHFDLGGGWRWLKWSPADIRLLTAGWRSYQLARLIRHKTKAVHNPT